MNDELAMRILDRIADVYDAETDKWSHDPHFALQDIEAWIVEEHVK